MRPQYHYAPAANWLSDPNGLVHDGRDWHLFYQYNPQGEDWGHMSWGHAVSPDLCTWRELPVALAEDERHMIFSGSAVIDRHGSAGFGPDALVAIYTGASTSGPQRQSQCIAHSADQGQTWHKFAGNPVLDREQADFRDPNVFWHAPSGRWIMVVALSEENRALLYASDDLKAWQELSSIETDGAPGHLWECPLLIELPVEGETGTRWLFKVDVLRGAPGSGALYRTGHFDGTRFVSDANEAWSVADWGNDFYAAIAWHEPRDAAGRPAWIGWIGNHAYQGQLPRQGWRGAMSTPRRLSLVRTGGELVLRQEVEPALLAQVPLADAGAAQALFAARLIQPGGADFALAVCDGEGRTVRVTRQGARLVLERTDPQSPFLDGSWQAEADPADPVEIWIDGGSVEVLAGRGCAALTVQHRLSGAEYRLERAEPAAASAA